MNIQPNPSNNRNSALNFDPTKKMRESIQIRQPLPPPADDLADKAAQTSKSADEIKAARDAFREQHQGRIANARLHYTTNQREAAAAQVTDAREKYNAKLEQRRTNTSDESSGPDRIEISERTKVLMERGAKVPERDPEARAARVSELREQYLEGRLSTDAMIQRAAHKMLGGE